METEHRIRIHQAVEYIKQDPEFPFDTHDELEDILEYYGIDNHLESKARMILAAEIRKITEVAQNNEILNLVMKELDVIDWD